VVENRDALEYLRDYVDAESSLEWQRKSGLETRAFGLVTANLGLLTLVLTLAKLLEVLPQLGQDCSRVFSIGGLSLGALSTSLALASAFPFKSYPSVRVGEIDELRRDILDSATDALTTLDELVEAKIRQLGDASKANTTKANLIVGSFVCAGLAAASYVTAFITAF